MPRASRRKSASLALSVLACVAVAVLAGLAALAPLAPSALAAEEPELGAEEPELGARAWVLVDAADGEVLAARAASRPGPVASTTKLMTAYVARRALGLDERVVAPAYAAAPVESLLGLREGERIRVRDLLAGLLLASGNDAAVALAEASSGSTSDFVDEMNSAARRLGLDDTRYANPIGLDEPDNRSSPADLATLAIELRRDPFLRRLFNAPRVRLLSGATRREVVNRNELVRKVSWVDGIKTGQTQGAGHVLVGSGTRKGVTLISVVLGTEGERQRDVATLRLLRYGFSLYQRITPVARSGRLASAAVRYRDERLPLVAARAVRLTVRDDQELDVRPLAPDEVEGPIERDERIGRAVVTVDGEVAARVPLLAARPVSEPTLFERVDAAVPGPGLTAWATAAVLVLTVGLGVILAARTRRRRREAG